MTTKTLNLNIELCDSGAIISYHDDGSKYAYSDETEACRSIANDIEHLITNNVDTNKFNIHIKITPQYAEE
jgi:hypothetical protein